jgi:hypothetical protein
MNGEVLDKLENLEQFLYQTLETMENKQEEKGEITNEFLIGSIEQTILDLLTAVDRAANMTEVSASISIAYKLVKVLAICAKK